MLCGSSFKNKGVQPLLDAVIDYLPVAARRSAADGHRAGQGRRGGPRRPSGPPDDNAPFAALAFKVMADPYVGKLTYFRVYSGTLKARARRS